MQATVDRDGPAGRLAEALAHDVQRKLADDTRIVQGWRMSTAELIFEKARKLPAELQQEALHYVDSLMARREENPESRTWSRFSAEQLAAHYAPEDAIYDHD